MNILRVPVLKFRSGVSAVLADRNGGWISGDIANLALSASVNVIFDLGPFWTQYRDLNVHLYPQTPSTGLGPVEVYGNDAAAMPTLNDLVFRSPLRSANGTMFSATIPSASGPTVLNTMVAGRYVIVRCTNADAAAAMGANASVGIVALPS